MGLNSHCSLNKFFIVNCAFPVTSNTYSTKEIRSRQNGKFGLQRLHWMSRSADESFNNVYKYQFQIYSYICGLFFGINFWSIKQFCLMFQFIQPLSLFDKIRIKTDMTIHHEYSPEKSFVKIFL